MSLNIYDFADIINAELELTRYANQKNRWTANFKHSEIKDGESLLVGAYGNGLKPELAISDYVRQIRGKTLIFHASNKELRKEYSVPNTIAYYEAR